MYTWGRARWDKDTDRPRIGKKMRARVQERDKEKLTDLGQDSKRHSTRQQQGSECSASHADGKDIEDVGNKEALDSEDKGFTEWKGDSDTRELEAETKTQNLSLKDPG